MNNHQHYVETIRAAFPPDRAAEILRLAKIQRGVAVPDPCRGRPVVRRAPVAAPCSVLRHPLMQPTLSTVEPADLKLAAGLGLRVGVFIVFGVLGV